MSFGEVEEKFNHAQLVIMSVIQEITHNDLKRKMGTGGNRGRLLNSGGTSEEQNANAMKYL